MEEVKACNERIIWEINNAIKDELKLQFKDAEEFYDPDLIDKDLIECNELCDKLLTYDYFEESESILDQAAEDSTFNNYEKLRRKWERAYNKELKNKKKDLERLFYLIANSSEVWC